MSLPTSIATNRFGLGARPNELAEAQKDPKNWLIAQLKQQPAVSFNASLPTSAQIGLKLDQYRKDKKARKLALKQGTNPKQLESKQPKGKSFHRDTLRQLATDTIVSLRQDSVTL